MCYTEFEYKAIVEGARKEKGLLNKVKMWIKELDQCNVY